MEYSGLTVAVTLFFVLNPVGNLPLFIALLKPFGHKRQAMIIVREMLVALGLMLLFAYAGKEILSGLGISKEAVTIGGGVILLLLAIRLVYPHSHHLSKDTPKTEPFIVPLATPIVAGGGTLATLMLYGIHVTNPWVLLWALLAAWGANTLIIALAPLISRVLSETVLTGIERLMGLVLTLIAAQMIISGGVSFVEAELSMVR